MHTCHFRMAVVETKFFGVPIRMANGARSDNN